MSWRIDRDAPATAEKPDEVTRPKSSRPQVDRRSSSLLATLKVELDLLALDQLTEIRSLERRDVDKHVLGSVVGLDKPITLRRVEPLYCSDWHRMFPNKCKYRPIDPIEFRIWGALTAVCSGGGSVTTRIEADTQVYNGIESARQLKSNGGERLFRPDGDYRDEVFFYSASRSQSRAEATQPRRHARRLIANHDRSGRGSSSLISHG